MKTASYIAAIHKALFSFQMIEEALKVCVGMSYEIIAKMAPPPIVFRFDPTEITNAPLERLIKLFSKVNGNAELVSDLGKVVKWRNFCAHNAFAHEFMNRASTSPFTAHGAEDVEVIVTFSSGLVERLGKELTAIRESHRAVIGTKSSVPAQAPNMAVNRTCAATDELT